MNLLCRTLLALMFVVLASCATDSGADRIAVMDADTAIPYVPYLVESGSATTTIFEDFEAGADKTPLFHFEETYGERPRYANGGAEVVAGVEGGFARYSFAAGFDHMNLIDGWHDSDAAFYFNLPTGATPDGYDGVSLSVRPWGFSTLSIVATQEKHDEKLLFETQHHVNPDEWTQLKIPWSIFETIESGHVIDPHLPVGVEFWIGFVDNYNRFHFREGSEMEARLDVDDIGLYVQKGEDRPELIENFEDEISRTPFSGEIYGASLFTDYSESDEGILKENKLVSDVSIIINRAIGGPTGGYLEVDGELSITGGENVPELTLFLRTSFAKEWPEYEWLVFSVRSIGIVECYVELWDAANDLYATISEPMDTEWMRLRLPLESLKKDLERLGEDADAPVQNHLLFSFYVDELAWAAAVAEGTLHIDVDLDEIVLE